MMQAETCNECTLIGWDKTGIIDKSILLHAWSNTTTISLQINIFLFFYGIMIFLSAIEATLVFSTTVET